MTDRPGMYEYLDFNAPMSGARADAMATALARHQPVTVLDIGCGWAELLLRVVAATEGAIGRGVDSNEPLIARGRTNAAQRGLAERVQLVVADGSEPVDPADLVICIGSDHAIGTQAEALRALRDMVRPGGRLLFGTGYWRRVPTADAAAAVGMTPDELLDLAGLVDLALSVGFRPLDVQAANADEWNAFESGFLADWEEWLICNPHHPDAAGIREKSDQHRTEWLRGYGSTLGFAYLTLGVASVA